MADEKEIIQTEEAPFEIEIVDEESSKVEEEPKVEETSEEDKEFSRRVQKRIGTLVQQRKQAEAETESARGELTSLKARLERLEHGNVQQAQKNFKQRYEDSRALLQKAIEEGDTEMQVAQQEQMTDMRAAMRVAEMQKRQRVDQQNSPTVGRVEQVRSEPPPEKAMVWWEKNRWFNSAGFDNETAAARAIDVQLEIEGFDKHSEEYYNLLNNRLQKLFPELISGNTNSTQTKSRSPVAPTAGGPSRKGNRVKLSKDELQIGRELGLTDEKSLKLYEAEIRNSRQEAKNG
mgnify:CR=1 FL=1|jgi:hypothetical protein|tara:strand:- start:7006 stop:7875 length:870 start_codon:yes stop_codon:yes gene_type:complete